MPDFCRRDMCKNIVTEWPVIEYQHQELLPNLNWEQGIFRQVGFWFIVTGVPIMNQVHETSWPVEF